MKREDMVIVVQRMCGVDGDALENHIADIEKKRVVEYADLVELEKLGVPILEWSAHYQGISIFELRGTVISDQTVINSIVASIEPVAEMFLGPNGEMRARYLALARSLHSRLPVGEKSNEVLAALEKSMILALDLIEG